MEIRKISLIKTAAISFLLTIFWSASAYAQPNITGFSGSLTNKGTLTITGSGFGTKNPAAPLIWTDGETGNATDYFSQLSPNASGPEYDTMFRTTIRGEAQAHSNSNRYLTGAHYPGTGSSSDYNVSAYKNFGLPLSKSFVSFYYKVDTKFAEALTYAAPDNYKLLAYSTNQSSMYGGCGTGCSYWYWCNNAVNDFSWKAPDWIANSVTGPPAVYPQTYGHVPWTHIPGTWSKVEAIAIHGTSGNVGSFKAFWNGLQVHNQWGYDEPFEVYGIGIGGYFNPYGKTDSNAVPVSWRYFDDIYIDNTWARVVIGNAPTWGASTIREMQIPSAWSDTTITITINQGSFANFNNVYLYVIDANGNVNENGYLLSSSGDGGGNTPPPPSSNSGNDASGGSGCGFVKDDGKGQGAKGEGLALMAMLIITLAGVAFLRKVAAQQARR